MYTPKSGEIVSIDDTLEMAVHQMIVGQHQSLLVMQGEDIVGILRLVDVFQQIGKLIKACAITPS
jgi:predicted transcriptional regulator